MVYNVLWELFFWGGVNLIHFSSTIMKGKNGKYITLIFHMRKLEWIEGYWYAKITCHKWELESRHPVDQPIHCLITVAGDFYKSTSNWTPKTSEVYKSPCPGEKNSGVWHGSLSQVRDKTHLFADWFYYVLRKGKKKCVSSWRHWDIWGQLNFTFPGTPILCL